jgi:outer membrane protein
MKHVFRIAVAFLLLAFTTKEVNAQTKVAHLDLDSLLNIMPEMKKATEDAAAYYKTLENQLYTMNIELDRKLNEYDSCTTRKIWSELIKGLKEKEIRDLQQNIQIFQQQAQVDYANKRSELVEPIYKKIIDAVKAVATRLGYTYVLDSSKTTGVVLYASPKDDILNAVMLELKIPIPAPKAPTPPGK